MGTRSHGGDPNGTAHGGEGAEQQHSHIPSPPRPSCLRRGFISIACGSDISSSTRGDIIPLLHLLPSCSWHCRLFPPCQLLSILSPSLLPLPVQQELGKGGGGKEVRKHLAGPCTATLPSQQAPATPSLVNPS